MSIYHCSIKIISRASGRSAVASAAYRSGEKLLNDETGIVHDFTAKGGVVMSEILLPEHAPLKYQDRQTLWNEVQKTEKRSDAQLAREVEVAFPTEMSRDQQIECVRAYIQENFVSNGMIADWALHDKGDGNPHAHIMLTVRGFDEQKRWQQKTKSVFANVRDENGKAIYDPKLPSYDPKDREKTSQYRIPVLDENGIQKTRIRKGKGTEYLWEKINIPANDWNDRENAERWRASWAKHCNRYLDLKKQIDHRSYARQGLDKEPTIHEGITARNMEKEGRTSERCQTNREVRERNSIREQIRKLAADITSMIMEKARELYGNCMSDLQNLQELLGLLQKQEEMIVLMEKLQDENEELQRRNKRMDRELEECQKELLQKTKSLEDTQTLNGKLNSENRRLTEQIERWNSLQNG